MKILSTIELAIPALKVIRFAKFIDPRGYFTEPFRQSDLGGAAGLAEFVDARVVQTNESRSKKNVIRGLHFQWNPFMGKLVRTLSGHMVDIALDIRKKSPTWGKVLLYDMPARDAEAWDEWIWVPPGFAHGNLFLEDTRIEYLCTGEYSQGCEAGISPFASDLDWSLIEPGLNRIFHAYNTTNAIISEKDANGLSLEKWAADPRSANFDF